MSDEHDEGTEKGFKVTDKRRVDRQAGVADTPNSSPAEPPPSMQAYSLPEIDFSTFILSLTTSAMVHLGETTDPDGNTQKDLLLAKQTIDIVAILKEKTRGNLTPDESKLIGDLLYDLRLRYVEAASKP